MKIVKDGLYRHYKGNNYRLIDIVKHSDSLEDLVLYQCMYENELSHLWVRPLKEFFSHIEENGQMTERFTYIGDKKGTNRL